MMNLPIGVDIEETELLIKELEDCMTNLKFFKFYGQQVLITCMMIDHRLVPMYGIRTYTYDLSNGSRIVLHRLNKKT